MIQPGDIVYLKFKGGLKNGVPNTSRLGLVIKELKEKGAISQFHVQFDQENPKWYWQHDLHRIGGERNKND